MLVTNHNQNKLRKIILTSILAALSIIIGLGEIPWPGAIISLRLDFSEVITIIAFFLLGFRGASLMLIIKAVARFLIIRLSFSPFGPLGGAYEEFVALLSSFFYLLCCVIITKLLKINFNQNEKPASKLVKGVLAVFVFIFVVTVCMVSMNFFFTTPMFLYFVTGQQNNFYITVFGMMNDVTYQNLIRNALGFEPTYSEFFRFCIVTFGPFNLVKAGISSIIAISIVATILPFFKARFFNESDINQTQKEQ